MKTSEEIKRGLVCCKDIGKCSCACPYYTECMYLLKGQVVKSDALAYIQQLEEQVPRWTSVEERLPEPFVPVLVHIPSEKPHPTVREGYVTRKGKWHACLCDLYPHEVTHWMPLPEPPEEDDYAAD